MLRGSKCAWTSTTRNKRELTAVSPSERTMAFLPKTAQKMALIVRTDLGMSQGKIAAQCAHAALECYLQANKGILKSLAAKMWFATGQPKIVLKVSSEKALMDLATAAHKAGLNVYAVRDAGKTQVKPGTITVVGIGPGSAERVDSVIEDLKLL